VSIVLRVFDLVFDLVYCHIQIPTLVVHITFIIRDRKAEPDRRSHIPNRHIKKTSAQRTTFYEEM
jgi:hypothetical protein